MIHNTGKPPSPLPKSFNNSTGKFSTRGTEFNESSWGEQTCGLIKLIIHKLWQESYDKVVAGAKEIVKRTHSSVRTEEVIDLTSDEPPDKFAMIVDLPLDKEDGNMVVVKNEPGNEDGYKGWDENDVAIYEDDEDEATQSLWSY